MAYLEVGEGQRLYYECCGDPDGPPAVYLHGGPGTGFGQGARRFFTRHRGVLFDQRGCGRSLPLAGDLRCQTTAHLIADLEALREHLGVDRWTLLGVSWGTTLALAYAQCHPQRVAAMVLALVTTTSKREVDWNTVQLGRVFPEAWQRFVACVGNERPVDAYARLLEDPRTSQQAARDWCDWDHAQMGQAPGPRFDDSDFRLRFARLVTHYWRHAAFLKDEQLLLDAPRLNGIPGVLLHGRQDLSCPLDIPLRLSQSWTTSRLQILDIGHGDAVVFPNAVTAALRLV
jgi:proline iminopeptidase